jgi:hypothetical protein
MTSTTPLAEAIVQLAANRPPEVVPALADAIRIAEVETKLRELASFERKPKAARRRFKMAAFLKWRELATARQRRGGS